MNMIDAEYELEHWRQAADKAAEQSEAAYNDVCRQLRDVYAALAASEARCRELERRGCELANSLSFRLCNECVAQMTAEMERLRAVRDGKEAGDGW